MEQIAQDLGQERPEVGLPARRLPGGRKNIQYTPRRVRYAAKAPDLDGVT